MLWHQQIGSDQALEEQTYCSENMESFKDIDDTRFIVDITFAFNVIILTLYIIRTLDCSGKYYMLKKQVTKNAIRGLCSLLCRVLTAGQKYFSKLLYTTRWWAVLLRLLYLAVDPHNFSSTARPFPSCIPMASVHL